MIIKFCTASFTFTLRGYDELLRWRKVPQTFKLFSHSVCKAFRSRHVEFARYCDICVYIVTVHFHETNRPHYMVCLSPPVVKISDFWQKIRSQSELRLYSYVHFRAAICDTLQQSPLYSGVFGGHSVAD
jgi:hypothetical protein